MNSNAPVAGSSQACPSVGSIGAHTSVDVNASGSLLGGNTTSLLTANKSSVDSPFFSTQVKKRMSTVKKQENRLYMSAVRCVNHVKKTSGNDDNS